MHSVLYKFIDFVESGRNMEAELTFKMAQYAHSFLEKITQHINTSFDIRYSSEVHSKMHIIFFSSYFYFIRDLV